MPLGDILELTSVLYALGLTKNLLLVLVMIDLGYVVEFDDQQDLTRKRCLDLGRDLVEFDDQQVLTRKRCLDLGWNLAKGIQESGLYRL